MPWNPCKKRKNKVALCTAWQGMKIFREEKGNYADSENLEWKLWKIPKFRADHGNEFSNVKLIAASIGGLLSFVSFHLSSSPRLRRRRRPASLARLLEWSGRRIAWTLHFKATARGLKGRLLLYLAFPRFHSSRLRSAKRGEDAINTNSINSNRKLSYLMETLALWHKTCSFQVIFFLVSHKFFRQWNLMRCDNASIMREKGTQSIRNRYQIPLWFPAIAKKRLRIDWKSAEKRLAASPTSLLKMRLS